MQNFPRYIWQHLQADADAFCFRYVDEDGGVEPYSYRQWTRRIQRVAVYLQEEGFEPGTRVGMVAPMCRGWMDVAFGVWMAGGCVVPVNHRLGRDRVLSCLGRSGCDWIVVANESERGRIRGQGEGLPPSLRWVLLDPDSESAGESVVALPNLIEEGRGLVARGRVEELAESVFPMPADSPALVLFDGDPSDDPHGALYNGDTLQRMVEHLSASTELDEESTTAIAAEPGRPAALLLAFIHAMKGAPLAMPEVPGTIEDELETFRPTKMVCSARFLRRRTQRWRRKLEDAPEFMQEEQKTTDDTDPESDGTAGEFESIGEQSADTSSSGSNFGLGTLLEKVGSSASERLVYRPLRRSLGGELETVIVAGEPLSAEVERVVEKAGPDVLNQFSLPECGISHIERPEERRPGAVGRPIDGYRCKIMDGEILIHADCLFDDYWDREGPREIRDGWLHTGVEGRLQNEMLELSNANTSSPEAPTK